MDITLYHNFSVENKLVKNLTELHSFEGVQMVEPVNDAEITIRMAMPSEELRWDDANYFQWDGAFYFIESIDFLANGISNINGRMDLLMTYQDAIKQLKVKAARTTSHGSARVADEMRTISVDSQRSVVKFPNQIDDSRLGGIYILVTSQRGYQAS